MYTERPQTLDPRLNILILRELVEKSDRLIYLLRLKAWGRVQGLDGEIQKISHKIKELKQKL